TLSVTDSACTFNIFSNGLLDLGTIGYATTIGTPPKSAIFANLSGCNGSKHCSAVSIDPTDTILTITLGDLNSGTVGAVAINPGITYTPDPAILGQANAPVSGSPPADTSKFF